MTSNTAHMTKETATKWSLEDICGCSQSTGFDRVSYVDVSPKKTKVKKKTKRCAQLYLFAQLICLIRNLNSLVILGFSGTIGRLDSCGMSH
jgi:hypothetical protein